MNAPEPNSAPEPKTAEEMTSGSEVKLKWAIIRFVLAIVVVVGLVILISVREGEAADQLREGLITNCEKNGNPLREVLQNRIHHEIEQTQNRALLEKFFPSISQKELSEFIAQSVKERREEIKEVAPIDCATLFQ